MQTLIICYSIGEKRSKIQLFVKTIVVFTGTNQCADKITKQNRTKSLKTFIQQN